MVSFSSMKLHTCFLSVFPEAVFSRECFATPRTRERPLSRVNHHVFFQLIVQSKGFAANLAHEWPQLYVFGSAVSNQMGFPLVTHTAVVTLERPLLCVLNHVKLELSCARPAFPAGVTEVRLLPRVFIQMPFQVRLLVEFLPAHWAWVTVCVPHHVRSQVVFCAELLPAVRTDVRRPISVLSLVENQPF